MILRTREIQIILKHANLPERPTPTNRAARMLLRLGSRHALEHLVHAPTPTTPFQSNWQYQSQFQNTKAIPFGPAVTLLEFILQIYLQRCKIIPYKGFHCSTGCKCRLHPTPISISREQSIKSPPVHWNFLQPERTRTLSEPIGNNIQDTLNERIKAQDSVRVNATFYETEKMKICAHC